MKPAWRYVCNTAVSAHINACSSIANCGTHVSYLIVCMSEIVIKCLVYCAMLVQQQWREYGCIKRFKWICLASSLLTSIYDKEASNSHAKCCQSVQISPQRLQIVPSATAALLWVQEPVERHHARLLGGCILSRSHLVIIKHVVSQ